MDDDTQAKCRVIAEFQGAPLRHQCACPDEPINGICYWHNYPENLNATMRAARRLPDDLKFCVVRMTAHEIANGEQLWGAEILNAHDSIICKGADTPQRAAFECISAYLAEHKEKKG